MQGFDNIWEDLLHYFEAARLTKEKLDEATTVSEAIMNKLRRVEGELLASRSYEAQLSEQLSEAIL